MTTDTTESILEMLELAADEAQRANLTWSRFSMLAWQSWRKAGVRNPWGQAEKGETGVCPRCQRSITFNGQYWEDSDGVTRCEAGHVHSVSGESAMPMRAQVRRPGGTQ